MPFCTTCGADVTGAFCSKCGAPAAGAAASAPPPPPMASPYPYAQPAAPGAPPPVRRTSPLVWVLVVILGFLLLCGLSFAAFVAFVGHRLHQAGVSFDRNGNGAVTIHSRDRDGKNAVVEFGGKGKLPSWVPVYPSSQSSATFSVRGTGDNGAEGGNFTFTTSDGPDRVKSFYSDKIRDMGMKVSVDTSTPEGGMIVGADEGGDQRSLSVVVGGHTGDTTVNVTYGRK